MTTGEGGMVVTKDDLLAERIRIMRSHGMTTLTWDRHKGHSFSYDVVARGYNYRLDEMRSALGIVQLGRLEENNALRRTLTRRYREEFNGLMDLIAPFVDGPEGSTHHLFPVLLRDGLRRPEFMTFLAEQGIQTSIHYPPIHLFSYYRALYPSGYDHHLPLTEEITSRLVTLPLFPTMISDQVMRVIDTIRKFFSH
jgi:dTDP-4-amino-4,6-dideoxygalactose transaminase